MLARFAFTLALSLPFASAHATGPNPSEALGSFFKLLSGLEGKSTDRQVKIAWYGDSAIISDGYTGEVRSRLQQRFGNAGPGFILAAPTFEGYLRDGVRLKRQGWESQAVIAGELKSGEYGYGGVVSTSFGGATATFEATTPVGAIEVWYEAIPKGGKLQLFLDGASTPTAVETTAGEGAKVWRHVPEKPVKSVKLRAGGEGLVRVFGLVLDTASRGLQLDPIGILGIRGRRWLNADASHLTQQVGKRSPDLIVLNFGGNERVDGGLTKASHKSDIGKTLDALRAGAPKASCLLVGPIAHGEDKGKGIVLDPELAIIYEAQREVADDKGCAFFDTLAAMGGKKALKTWRDKNWLSGDYAHLTNKGHETLGDLMADWLLGAYDAWKK
jgi:lysophospholipase L1-like esterase